MGCSKTEISSNGKLQESTIPSLHECVIKAKNSRIPPSIYMVPSTLRDLKASSFSPRVVSIGPLHRKNDKVQAFEERKPSYLIDLLDPITDSLQEKTLESCMERARSSMERIKACYIWTKTYDDDDDEIARMMVMDACFILGFILRVETSGNSKNLLTQAVIYDLVLLENQIPLFFLEEIFQCTVLKFKPDVSLIEFLQPVLDHLRLFVGEMNFHNISTDTNPHILSLLHECYKPQGDNISADTLSSTIRSAVDLDRAGVHFRPNENPTWLMEMEVNTHRYPCFFWSWNKTTLKMPVLKVHHFSELVLRNLIVYEQLRNNISKYITSYAVAMDMLVNTQEDVAMLIESGVLVNFMGSNEEVANMINSINKEVVCADFFYGKQLVMLNKYCNDYWPKHLARMRRTYFSSPWSMIALVAGIILFVLTVLQTIFTVTPFGRN